MEVWEFVSWNCLATAQYLVCICVWDWGVLLASFGLEDLETEFKWGILLKATFRRDSSVEGALESEDLYSSFISVVN